MNFEQTLRVSGLLPREVIADGKLRRCATEAKPSKRNGWYVLHPDGRGVWGDNAVAPRAALGHWRDESAAPTPVSPEIRRQIEARRAAERAERVNSMRRAREFYANAKPLRQPHPYIAKKGLTQQGCAGLRMNKGLLVIPVHSGEWLISVQTIAEGGQKRFWPGASVKGGAFAITRANAALTAICEGFATGLAIYQSVRQASVIVAFDCGNLLPVVERIRPSGSVVMVADNDHKTFSKIGSNPGIEKAKNAALLLDAGVWWPTDIEGSDAADYLAEVGEGAARKLERAVLAAARYVSPRERVP